MKLSTLKDAEINGKKVLLRLDLNVPLKDGRIEDATRIEESLPTLKFLIEGGAAIIILSHLGRPKGKIVEELRLDPVANALKELLKVPVRKFNSCIGEEVVNAVRSMYPGDVFLLENTRFYPEEEANDEAFAKKLASLADIFVCDAFGTVHRAHASTVGVTKFLPSFAGLLLEKEISVLHKLLEAPERPVCLISGGAKIDTKIGVLNNFLAFADYFLIGGALANTFLAAEEKPIGSSLFEKEKLSVAQDFLMKSKSKNVLLPTDVVVSNEVSSMASASVVLDSNVLPDQKILDIGPASANNFAEAILISKTIIWNGPLGLYEFPQFESGSRTVAEAIVKSSAISIIGGGDTIDCVKKMGISLDKFSHVSTGGGAMLEYLEGKELPGIQALMRK